MKASDVVEALGLVLIVAATALVSVPAALATAGVALLLVGFALDARQ